MPECKDHYFCGRDVEDGSVEGLCILHSTDPSKDKHAFIEALAIYREQKGEYGDYYINFVFPGRVISVTPPLPIGCTSVALRSPRRLTSQIVVTP